MAVSMFMNSIWTIISPVWVECSCMLFFILGFFYLRFDLVRRSTSTACAKSIEEPKTPTYDNSLKKAIETASAASDPTAVLTAWRSGKESSSTPLELLKLVVQAFVDIEPGSLVEEIVEHMGAHVALLGNARVASGVLDIVARAGYNEAMCELWDAIEQKLGVRPSYHVYEVLLGGYASAGNSAKVSEILGTLSEGHTRLTARSYSLIIKGYLKNGMVDKVLEQMRLMKLRNFYVPSFAVIQLFRIACEAGRAAEVFEVAKDQAPLPAEAVVLLLEDCVKRSDLPFAQQVEKAARDSKVPLLCSAYDSLLKLYTLAGDLHALEVFEALQASQHRISEGLCVGLLARCADAKFLRFAEEIVRHVRAHDGMSIAVYSALMKVYAYCGMYDRACDLYDRIREDNLEPDAMMYGCLMKFAVECGRTELSRELSERVPTLDIQNYMSLIRAAGRDKDVNRAFSVLKKLKSSGLSPDLAAYNCVLDVCVSAGDTNGARGLVEEMRKISSLDIITYNTLLKGYCSAGDLHGAKGMLEEMRQEGVRPNDVSYNCMINAAVSMGNFREAWEMIELMEKDGIGVDHYTVSIMMKALKRIRNSKDVAKAMGLLDRSGLDVCSDEIMFNTVLETCIQHREYHRLQSALNAFSCSSLHPSVHTYGTLIKACSALKQVDRCWVFWRQMAEDRAIAPNDIVLGCMLDALVCNNQIDEAVMLFDEWKVRVPPNMVMCSTIIKGFANTRQGPRAMKMWREMHASGISMNTVLYNVAIDAQARIGAMDEVSELVEAMAPDNCQPDAITYSTIVKGYCVKGDLDKAYEVFTNTQKNNMAHDAIIYNTVLDGCTRHGRWDIADKVLQDMERNKVSASSFTLGILVKMHGRRHQLDKAFEAVEQLPKKHGFTLNAQVSTCLMCACLNNNAVDKAISVFEELKASGHGADAKAYGALIAGCTRHGQPETAVDLVEEAYGLKGSNTAKRGQRGLPHGQSLEPEPLEQLFRALHQHDLMKRLGAPLLEKLRVAKVPVSGRLFNSLVGGSKRDGDFHRGSVANGAQRGKFNAGCT